MISPMSQPTNPPSIAPAHSPAIAPTTIPITSPSHVMVCSLWLFSPLLPVAAHGEHGLLQSFGCRERWRDGRRRLQGDAPARREVRELRHRAPAAPAEETAPQSLQRERDHRHRGALDNAPDAALERIE